MTIAGVLLFLAAVLVLMLAWHGFRSDREHARRIRRYQELSDLSRGDVDPDWERTRDTMTRPDRRLRRFR